MCDGPFKYYVKDIGVGVGWANKALRLFLPSKSLEVSGFRKRQFFLTLCTENVLM